MNLSETILKHIDSCRFCWMCRHICPIGIATGQERNTPRARALALSMVSRGSSGLEEVAENLYECALCGACVKECVTGWDPVRFTLAARTEACLGGVLPEYILKLIENCEKSANIYGKPLDESLPFREKMTDTLFYFGETARFQNPRAIRDVTELLDRAGVRYTTLKGETPSGNSLYFLTGKTNETSAQMSRCAEQLSQYENVVVYDPADLKFLLREYKEFGFDLKVKILSFEAYLLGLVKMGKIVLDKSGEEYALQDNFNLSRELESGGARELISAFGKLREMLLSGKDTMIAGNLIMNQYMPDVMRQVALNRWKNAGNAGVRHLITESPDEYVLLEAIRPEGFCVSSIEQAVLKHLKES